MFENVEHVIVPDSSYALLTKKFLLGGGYSGYESWLFDFVSIGGWNYRFDCDDRAASYKLYMRGLHYYHNQNNADGAESVAVGDCYYLLAKDKGHAINVAIIYEDNDYRKLYIEPQSGNELELSDLERNSIWYVGF
ncbi:MAG: hypothetical protein GY861_22425 [bacterium]|nr:hypothetical protein [bacterium]